MPSNVITYPKHVNLPLYADLKFRYTHGVNLEVGQQLSVSASAQLVVMDQLGRNVLNTFEGVRGSTSFTWEIEYKDIEHIPHGARYRLFIDNGTEVTRYIAQAGAMVWVGR